MKSSTHFRPARLLALAGLLAVSSIAVACSKDSPGEPCAPFVFYAVWVSVHDDATGARLDTARGFIRDGGYVDSLLIDEGVGRAGEERPGTYEVVVLKDGYKTWRQSGVAVTRDECHVVTVRLDVSLEKE